MLATAELKDHVDRGCPLVLGGPLPHVMAAKAVAFTEALRPEFTTYAHRIVDNARGTRPKPFSARDSRCSPAEPTTICWCSTWRPPTGSPGRQAEDAVRKCGITLNRNPIPFDPNGPWYTSGLRFGTAAVTTLGMGQAEMKEIAAVVALVLNT